MHHRRSLLLNFYIYFFSIIYCILSGVSCQCTVGLTTFSFHSCPFLVEHLTVFIPVIGGVLFVFVVISLLRTSFTDPGILPRATPDEAADIEKQIGKVHPGIEYMLWDRWGKRALPYGGSLRDACLLL